MGAAGFAVKGRPKRSGARARDDGRMVSARASPAALARCCASTDRQMPSMRSGRKWRWKADNDFARHGIVFAIGLDAVTVIAERLLQRGDSVAAVAGPQHLAKIHDRRRLDPMADAGLVKRAPGKFLTRILLARRRDVGMRYTPVPAEWYCGSGYCGTAPSPRRSGAWGNPDSRGRGRDWRSRFRSSRN